MVVSLLVHTAASPIRILKARALMTLMTAGMSSWNITAGSSFKPSISVSMERCGIRIYPAVILMKAARIEEM